MAEDQKSSAGYDAPEQPENIRKANLSGVTPNSATASGLAARDAFQGEPDRPENHGSTVPIAGGEPQPDLQGLGTAAEPVGAQAQQATFVPNGSVPAGMAASNYGFVSAGALHSDPAQALEAQRVMVSSPTKQSRIEGDEYGARLLTDAEIDRANPNELRAAAIDRGFDLGAERGGRGTRAAFKEAQRDERKRREELATADEEETE